MANGIISFYRIASAFSKNSTIKKLTNVDCVGFNFTSNLVGHFVSSPKEREKRYRRDSREDERDSQGRKWNRKVSAETEK